MATTVTYGVANTADDATDAPTLSVYLDTTVATGDLTGSGGIATCGLRFILTDIPFGAVITSAVLTLQRQEGVQSGTSWGSFRRSAALNPASWSSANRPSGATKAGTGVVIGAAAPNTVQTFELATLVHDHVNTVGYAQGNAIAIVSDPTGANGATGWVDFNTNPAQAATLTITYEAGGPDVTPPTITSTATPSVIEGEPFSQTLTASEPATFAIVGGADAGLFTLTGAVLSLSAQIYPAGPFVVQVTAEDAAGNISAPQTITLTVTEAPLIRWVGSTPGTTTAAAPAHRAGDLIIAWAPRDGNNAQPTLPSGQNWTDLNPSAGTNTISGRLAGKKATGSAEGVGTFTSATSILVSVYRPKPGYELSFGAVAAASAASTTINWPVLPLQDTSGRSVVVGVVAHRSVNTSIDQPPPDMINRASVLDATDEAAIHDSGVGVTSWAARNQSVGGTSSGWRAVLLEIKATSTGSADGTASGITATVSTSLTAGTASGARNATQAGMTATVAATMAAGSASASQSGAASGQLLTVATDLASGLASAVRNASAVGFAATAAATLSPGSGTGERTGTAAGAQLVATASLSQGAASGNASATGLNASIAAALSAGSASGAASASGGSWTVASVLSSGVASAGASGQAQGASFFVPASLTPGAPSAQRSAVVTGLAFTATTSFAPGRAAASSSGVAAGAALSVTSALAPGYAGGSAGSSGAQLQLFASLLTGAASGSAEGDGPVWSVIATFAPGSGASFVEVAVPPERRAVLQRTDRHVDLAAGIRKAVLSSADRTATLTRQPRRATLPASSRRITLS